jgi:kinesin family protein 11
MKDIGIQMKALDDFVTRARSQNAQHHDSHVTSLQGLSTTVKSSYSNIGSHFTSTYERVRDLGNEMSTQTSSLQESIAPLDSVLRQPLAELRENISRTALQEYQPTGETPQKIQYLYPTELPCTEAHETLLAALRCPTSSSPSKQTTMIPVVFNDGPGDQVTNPSEFQERVRRRTGGLREIDANIINVGLLNSELHHQSLQSIPSSGKGVRPSTSGGENQKENNALPQIPSFKRSMSGKLPLAVQKSGGKRNTVAASEGRENVNPAQAAFSQSVGGRRRSPRTGGS